MIRRFLPFILTAGVSTFFFFVLFQSGSWRRIPESIGLGEVVEPTEEEKANAWPDLRLSKPKQDGDPVVGNGVFREPMVESNSPYPVGQTKPPGSNYTKALVVSKLKTEKSNWVHDELGDMIESGLLTPYLYVMNDKFAPLHPPINKGHEAMAYLSYIIDFYDDLKDANIFMHFHREAWHNNKLVLESPLMVRYLSPERVTREGYMNLRCHWDPGCPSWLHPGATERDPEKQEEWLIADSWAELFPLDPVPTVLSQPCCAQFAVSRDRIREIPKQRYVTIRDWIMRTDLPDFLSGRVFEYIWQFIFTASPIHCPSTLACYCDGYGFCFGDGETFDRWFELQYLHDGYQEELRIWTEHAERIDEAKKHSKDGRLGGEESLEVPQPGKDKWLQQEVDNLWAEMEELKQQAFERGRDPKQRALESGREWHEGDGF